MFVFDVKEIFQQKIFDILIFLIIIHVGSGMISFLIKCYHTYFKNYAKMSEEMEENPADKYPPNSGPQAKSKYKKKEEKIFYGEESESESSDEDYFNMIDNLKSFLDLIPPEVSNKNKISHKTLRSRDISYLKKALKTKCKPEDEKLSNETQTNITINPKVNIDYSCPKLILAEVSSGIPIENKSSSECFESASSGNSDSICIDDENEYSPMFRHLGCCDLLKYKKINLTNITKTVQNQDVCPKKQYNNNTVLQKDLGKLHENCGKQLSKENRIIEMAINEFEKELKPIKDQIKLLKECLNDFEEFDTELHIPSDFSSSATGTLGHNESYSGVMSTSCSTIINGNISTPLTILGKKHASFVSESELTNNFMKTVKKLPHLLSNKKESIFDQFSNINEKPSLSNDIRQSPDSDNFQKRSPMADMYIQLSQYNSKTGSTRGKRQHKLVQSEDGKTITYHINLNVNIGPASTTNMQKTNFPKERNLLPVVSGPEDIIGNPSNTHVCLRPG